MFGTKLLAFGLTSVSPTSPLPHLLNCTLLLKKTKNSKSYFLRSVKIETPTFSLDSDAKTVELERFLKIEKFELWPHKSGRCWQKVAIWRWSLCQVWLYFGSKHFWLSFFLIKNRDSAEASQYDLFWPITLTADFYFVTFIYFLNGQDYFKGLSINNKYHYFCVPGILIRSFLSSMGSLPSFYCQFFCYTNYRWR